MLVGGLFSADLNWGFWYNDIRTAYNAPGVQEVTALQPAGANLLLGLRLRAAQQRLAGF